MNVEEFITIIQKFKPDINVNALKKACSKCIDAHKSQLRASGEPYYFHPFIVATILAEMKLDEDSIITALLHDTVEDTTLTLKDIEKDFNPTVKKLVDGVTKLAKIKLQPNQMRQEENFRKLFMAMSEDIRVLLIKLADRLHNMRTIHHILDESKRKRIAHETMEIYAPLAERMGIQVIKNELQDLAFNILHPEERDSIMHRLVFLRKDGIIVIDKIEEHIKKTIAESKMKSTIFGREKTPCSIWQKMKFKNINFEQLSDIIAFRIIVATTAECYYILGVIHAAYHMVPGSFKDYISTPKENGYRSLHTVVVGPEKQRIEIQIRTKEMNEINELGVAAHWMYKQQNTVHCTDGMQYRWVRELVSILEQSNNDEFVEQTKLEMYDDQVFCFTPKGQIVALPKLSTPVDFAYALHSDMGHTCIGVKVNGRVAALRHKLENGDQVEIICSKAQVPSISWEKFVVTGKAKSEIRRFIKIQEKKEYANLGKAILSKYFVQEGYVFDEKIILDRMDEFRYKTVDDLYAAVGEGTLKREKVLKSICEPINNVKLSFRETFPFFKFVKKEKQHESSISVKGLIPGMALNFAACCHPLPGDPIVGIVHIGKGVTIHTSDCDILDNFTSNPERWIDVSWEKDNQDDMYIGRIRATLVNEVGALATTTTVIAKSNSNITNLKVINRSSDFFDVIIDLELLGVRHLFGIIASLRSKSCVYSVERSKL